MTIIPFDDRDGWIWYDGEIVPWREAKVHVLTHGLHYGSCVFEGEAVYNGTVFKLTEHSERLRASAELLGFSLPYSTEELNQATQDIVAKQGIENGYVRPLAWRGSEQMAILTDQSKIHVAIATWTWPAYYTDAAKRQGAKLTYAKWKRPSPETAPHAAKAAGLYMICTLSKNAAVEAGFQEALMLDWRGYVAETTSSNVFFVIDGALHTPTPDCFLDGITRRTVMDLAKKRGIEVIERHIKPEEIASAQEMFLTGTAAEVTPVAQLDDQEFSVGPIGTQLMEDYDALVRG